MTAAACPACGATLPAAVLAVTDVAVLIASPANEDAGLLAWASLRVGPLAVDGLSVRRTMAGEIIVRYPARKDGRGGLHRIVTAVDPDVDGRIRTAVVAAYLEARRRIGREGRR